MSEPQRHRAGLFKQQNKRHKVGRHRSKGQLDAEVKGKSDVSNQSLSRRKELSRLERKNQAKQIRQSKREESLNRRRMLSSETAPPLLVAIIALDEYLDANTILRLLTACDETAIVTQTTPGYVHMAMPRLKQRFSFVIPNSDDQFSMLDLLKVSDAAMFIWNPMNELEDDYDLLLSSAKAQGLPSVQHVVQGLSSYTGKRLQDAKKRLMKRLELHSFEPKFHALENLTDALTVLRQLGAGKRRPLTMQERRPYLLAEKLEFEKGSDSSETMMLYGYVRGPPLSVNDLIHLTGWGDFQMKQIDLCTDPHPLVLGKRNKMEEDEQITVLEVADPKRQALLECEAPVDPLDAEQTWPNSDDLKLAEIEAANSKRQAKKVPKGTSEYQAAWITEGSENENENENGSVSDDDENQIEAMMSQESVADDDDADWETEDEDVVSMQEEMDQYDNTIDVDEEKQMLERLRAEKEQQQFPDEIDTPLDQPARIRFQRYRGLKNFRTAEWDPSENLPADYSRIFKFANFRRTKKRVLNADRDGAMHGWYVRIQISGIGNELKEFASSGRPLIAFGLLEHEHQMSILNVVVMRHRSLPSNVSIKAKDQLIFQVGYRRFATTPIFSEHTNSNKHRFLRFLPASGAAVATMFAPIIFPPAPVLIYRLRKNQLQLVATGSVLDVNPDRIVCKRIFLSGSPMKIHQRTSVIRYMFFNREDILWFKPVELRTKHGRKGHIKEPLGTHGHMKCTFDGILKSEDSILLPLYKRVFPKWNFQPVVSTLLPPKNVADNKTDSGMELE